MTNSEYHSVLGDIPPGSVINKDSPVPLHHQLERFLRSGIESGLFPPNEKLPTEREIQNHFGLSRTPVRQAIGKLVNDGLVIRRRSLGTVVLPQPFEESLTALTTFTEEVRSRGQVPAARLISLGVTVANPEVARHLRVLPETKIFEVVRLRTIDDEPVGLIYSHIPVEIAPLLKKGSFSASGERQSIYRVLELDYDIRLTRAVETFRAVNADREKSKLLDLPNESAVLLRSRTAFDSSNQAIAYENGYYRIQYRIEWQGHEARNFNPEFAAEE